jgi:hypothetical protein
MAGYIKYLIPRGIDSACLLPFNKKPFLSAFWYTYSMEYTKEKRHDDYIKRKEWARDYYLKNKQKHLDRANTYHAAHREKINAGRRERRALERSLAGLKPLTRIRSGLPIGIGKCKEEVLKFYGGKCACCGEENIKFLTIDHINNNGKEHGNGKGRYKGEMLYRFLKANTYPGGIQVLCFNCNIGRRNNGGICPHKK